MSHDVSLLSDDDLYLFNEVSHYRLHEIPGAHHMNTSGIDGTYYTVWTPNSRRVFITGKSMACP
jgi:1,4-alpha-glucan branching enzyme